MASSLLLYCCFNNIKVLPLYYMELWQQTAFILIAAMGQLIF